jgi:hypothetical protein
LIGLQLVAPSTPQTMLHDSTLRVFLRTARQSKIQKRKMKKYQEWKKSALSIILTMSHDPKTKGLASEKVEIKKYRKKEAFII